MSRSKFWSVSQSTVRVALATTAVATLAIIGACSEGGVASNVAAPSLTPRYYTGPILANAGVATVCVGASSPQGIYTFVNSGFNNVPNPSYPGSTTTENVADGTPYQLNKNSSGEVCVDVMTRIGVPLDALQDNFSNVTVANTIAPSGIVFSSTTCEIDPGNVQTTTCVFPAGSPYLGSGTTNGPTVYMNRFHGSKTTFNFAPCTVGCAIGTPQFVVGDLATGLLLAKSVNFWGSQWWKNNPMTLYKENGWPSFKGYATTADNFCGGEWTSRVGNSPPPPATIGADVIVVVTSNVWKDGPDIRGNIRAIISVKQDGGYGPNPGHDGNGPWTLLCGTYGPLP